MTARPRILVLGRDGQVARSFADLQRPEVICVGRLEADVTDIDSIARTIARTSPDVVVNPAAYTAVDKAESEESLAFAVNAEGAGKVARAAADAGLPVVHVSTDYVFDGEKGAPYAPGDPTNPINAYGRSKLAGELAVAAANPRHVIVRTSWVYSPYGTNFVKTMLRLGRERDALSIVDDQRGCPTAAQDIAHALATVAERATGEGGARWGVYHFAGPEECVWFELAQAVFQASAAHGAPAPSLRPIATADWPTPARRARDTRLQSSADGLLRGLTARGYRAVLPGLVEGLLSARGERPV